MVDSMAVANALVNGGYRRLEYKGKSGGFTAQILRMDISVKHKLVYLSVGAVKTGNGQITTFTFCISAVQLLAEEPGRVQLASLSLLVAEKEDHDHVVFFK